MNEMKEVLKDVVIEKTEQELFDENILKRNLTHQYRLKDVLEYGGAQKLTPAIVITLMKKLRAFLPDNMVISNPKRGMPSVIFTGATCNDDLLLEISDVFDNMPTKSLRVPVLNYIKGIKRYINNKTAPVKDDKNVQKKAFNITPYVKKIEKPVINEITNTEDIQDGSMEQILVKAREMVKLINKFELKCDGISEELIKVDQERNDFLHALELSNLDDLEAHSITLKLGKEIMEKRRIIKNAQDDLNDVLELKRLAHLTIKGMYLRESKIYSLRSEMFKHILSGDRILKQGEERKDD